MSNVKIFVSFDLDHDGDLFDRLLAHSGDGSPGFHITGHSRESMLSDPDRAGLRRQIREADQVIVICGEHTEACSGVFAELQITQEETKPYFLLCGRRDRMCTKPQGAKSQEGMYGWAFVWDQITLLERNAAREGATREMKRARIQE